MPRAVLLRGHGPAARGGLRRRHRARAAIAFLLLLAPAARAQLLDLSGGPRTPPAGEGVAAVELAERLAKAADAIAPGTRGASARSAVRRLASMLLTTGERAGGDGSVRVLLGMTLAARLDAIDALLLAEDDASLAIIARDIELGSALLARTGADPDLAVRDALAMLAADAIAPEMGGWITDDPRAAPLAPPADPAPLLVAAGLAPDAAAAATELASLLDAASRVRATSRTAPVRAASLARALGLLDPARAWIDAASRAQIAQRIADACRAMLDPDDAAARAAADELDRLARSARIAERLDALEERIVAPARPVVLTQVLAPDGTPSAVVRRLEGTERVLTLLAARSTLEPEDSLVRQLRPAHRWLTEQLRRNEPRLALALPDIVRADGAMADPRVLAVIRVHETLVDQLRAVESLSGVVGVQAEGAREPIVAEGLAPIAGAALALGQDLARARETADTTAALHDLAREALAWHALRADPGAASTRTAWIEAHLRGRDADRAPAVGRQLRALHARARLLEIRDAAEDAASLAALDAWPGWECDARARAVLLADFAHACDRAADRVLADPDAAAGDLDAVARRHPAAMLLGRLALEAQRRGLSTDPLAELAAGGCFEGPADVASWLCWARRDLADICRYAAELAAAQDLREDARADELASLVKRRAERVLERLPPW